MQRPPYRPDGKNPFPIPAKNPQQPEQAQIDGEPSEPEDASARIGGSNFPAPRPEASTNGNISPQRPGLGQRPVEFQPPGYDQAPPNPTGEMAGVFPGILLVGLSHLDENYGGGPGGDGVPGLGGDYPGWITLDTRDAAQICGWPWSHDWVDQMEIAEAAGLIRQRAPWTWAFSIEFFAHFPAARRWLKLERGRESMR